MASRRRHHQSRNPLCSLALLLLALLSLLHLAHASLLSTSRALSGLGRWSQVVGFGDFDADTHTDLLVLDSQNATLAINATWAVEVWLWKASSGTFVSSGARVLSSRAVVNVVGGDFDHDGSLDILVASPDTDSWSRPITRLLLHMGDHKGFPRSMELPPAAGQVLVADFNNDLWLDLFGTSWTYAAPDIETQARQETSSRQQQPLTEFSLGQQQNQGRRRKQKERRAIRVQAVDANRTATQRSYWRNAAQEGATLPSFTVVAQPLDQVYSEYPVRSTGVALTSPMADLAEPHSHAFVDLNGDCMADLVVTSTGVLSGTTTKRTFIEIWVNHARTGPVFNSISLLPLGAGQLSFADVDGDGNIDIIVPVFTTNDATNEIYIYYNRAKQLCGSAYDNDDVHGCRKETALCVADDLFEFDFMFDLPSGQVSPSQSGANLVVYQFPVGSLGGRMFDPYVASLGAANPAYQPPFTLRLGDLDLDGFPDLLLALTPTPPTEGEEDYAVVELWLNIACPKESTAWSGSTVTRDAEGVVCSDAAKARGRRVFSASASGLDAANNLLSSVSGAYAGASFFDLADNGKVDVIFTARQPTSPYSEEDLPAGAFSSHAFVSSLSEDAYFLTTLSSNGVCPAWCPAPGPTFPSLKPYGVNHVGATFKLAYTDLAGDQHTAVGSALMQSGYMALSPPYVTFGLGRTNTFIDALFIGLALNESQHSRSWVSMVPNAQIIVFPYPRDQPDEWTLELFFAPSSHLLWVAVSWAALLTLLALVIAYLHVKEKREDEKEKRKTGHQLLFTF